MQARLDEVLARAVARTVVGLGFGRDAAAVADDLQRLAAPALSRFAAHPNWPSRLTGHRVPFELSLTLGTRDSCALRYIVDTTDYRRGLDGNLDSYLDPAGVATRADAAGSARVGELIRGHLEGSPQCPTRTDMYAVVGTGYASRGRRQGKLYFGTSWWPIHELLSLIHI